MHFEELVLEARIPDREFPEQLRERRVETK